MGEQFGHFLAQFAVRAALPRQELVALRPIQRERFAEEFLDAHESIAVHGEGSPQPG